MTDTFKAVAIPVNGKAEVVEWSTTDKPNYQHLQDHVGGLIDIVALGRFDLWLNEDGPELGLGWNPYAQALAISETGQYVKPLVGTAVVTGRADADGETQPLTDHEVQVVVDYCAVLRRMWGGDGL